MKSFALIAIAAAVVIVYLGATSTSENDEAFRTFISQYGRNYASEDEYSMRRSIFNEQMRKVEEHNAKNLSWTLGINQFSDWTPEEYSKLLGLKASEHSQVIFPVKAFPKADKDKTIDWREIEGYVTPIKNQGRCGSCWTFSATGAMEGAYFKKYKQAVVLSESQVLDCDKFSHGCNGGLQENAFYHWMKFGPISEEHYTYAPQDRACKEKQVGADYPELPIAFRVDVGDDLLYDALVHQPVAISIRAENDAFRSYKSGIIDGPDCGTDLDHAVLLVGYNAEEQYWIVKNSWGESWGENGYVRIKRRDGKGICGINQENSVPVYEDDF